MREISFAQALDEAIADEEPRIAPGLDFLFFALPT